MRNVRHKQVQDNMKKSRIICLTFGIMLFIYLTINLIIGEKGLLKYIKLKAIKNTFVAETEAMKKQNEDANTQVEALQNEPDRVEELAREYGLTKKGELIFKFNDKK